MLTARRGRLVKTGAAALLTGVLALTAAACGDEDAKADSPPTGQSTEQPTEQASDQPTGDPSTPAADATGKPGDLPDPCKGFTQADITTWTGLPIQADDSGNFGGPDPYSPEDITRECTYGIKGGHLLMATVRTPADQFAPPGESATVDGIGDKAYFIKANNELHVLKGDLEVVVSFTKDSSPSGDLTLIPAQKTIATKILEVTTA